MLEPIVVSPNQQRVLPVDPYLTLEAYVANGGGRGLSAARAVNGEDIHAALG